MRGESGGALDAARHGGNAAAEPAGRRQARHRIRFRRARPRATRIGACADRGPGTRPRRNKPLALTFRDYSWTEVRDRDGRAAAVGDESRRHGADPFRHAALRHRDRQRRRCPPHLQGQSRRPRPSHAAERRPAHAAMTPIPRERAMTPAAPHRAAPHAAGRRRRRQDRRRRAHRRAVDDEHRHRGCRRDRRAGARARRRRLRARSRDVNSAEAAAAVPAIRERLDAVGLPRPARRRFPLQRPQAAARPPGMRPRAGEVPDQSRQRRQGVEARQPVRRDDRGGRPARQAGADRRELGQPRRRSPRADDGRQRQGGRDRRRPTP